MVNALLLLLAAAPFQQKVEKIHLKYVEPAALMRQLNIFGQDAQLPVGIYQVVADPTDNSILVKGEPDAIEQFKKRVSMYDIKGATETLVLKNVSAKYLLDLLTGNKLDPSPSFIPKEVTLVRDEGKNAINVSGPPDSVRETMLLLEVFDVRPQSISLELRGAMPTMGRTISSSGEVVNNSLWSYADESADTSLTVRPRVNGDGTITVLIDGVAMSSSLRVVCRLKPGETLYYRALPPGTASTVVNYIVRGKRIDEKAFLDGSPLRKLDWELPSDSTPVQPGEVRLILRASLHTN